MMDKKSLQKKLNQPYSTENWREVVQFVFPNVQILNPPMMIPIDNDKVEQFRQLGNVQLHDGKTLALFELKLKENVNIIRNRVELNNIVSRYIDQDQTHGVLSIFEKGGDDYRFTFSASASEFDEEEGDFVTKKTDTKRFTYVLGKNESCKTPAQRFYELSENKNKAEIKDIENAFSVEKLSKAFFKEYKDQYSAFVNFMMQTPGIFKTIYNGDDKAIRDFVKLLLGRIIFIKFVQKKGWMGVDAASKKWENGDFRFLENSFTNFKHQDLFYSTFLEPLFETLNTPNRPNDIFAVTNTRVPYLSGGLFELEDKKTKNINFPAKYFNDLFEFLDRYNFTIDENDSNDHEVGIDPEMLGHIFENLLEDNKDKGAFYTPKEIVRYMCQESLKEYLKTSLENNNQWPTDETEAKNFEQALHNFVTKKEAGGIIEFEETIARALKEVKICDPAIGSGAFPMGLLNEIFQLVHKLHEANKDKVERVWELKGWQPNLVKQNIIQNSIYGVDIEKGAVDVARLRFWLSLIVDEPEPKALPHLDYKIVVGNSLVSKLDDTIIDIDWEVKEKVANLFGNENEERQQLLLKEISAKQKLVFDPNSDEEKLSLEIRNLKIDLLINQLELMVNTKGVATKPTGTSKTIKAQTELWLETIGWKQQIEKLQKLKKNPNETLHFFDWKLDFPEIMNEQVTDKVGFDIVIANPPYIGQSGNRDVFREVLNTNFGKEFHQRRMDYFYFFFHKSILLGKRNTVLTFITTNYFLNATYADKLRKDLFKNCEFTKLINFNEAKVFESATGQHNAISILKIGKNKNNFVETALTSRKGILDGKTINDILHGNDKLTKSIKFLSFDIFEEPKYHILIEGLNGNSENLSANVLNSIKSRGKRLVDVVDIVQGIVSGANNLSPKYKVEYNIQKEEGSGILILQQNEINNLNLNSFEKNILKPWFKNSDISKWICNEETNQFVIYLTSKDEIDENKIPNLLNHFEAFKPLLINRNVRTGRYTINNYTDFINNKFDIPYVMIKSSFKNGKYYLLSYSRDKYVFESPKIVCPQRSHLNTFAYTEKPWYGASDVYYIVENKKNIINLKYVLSILNSKLIFFWLNNKCQKKGEMLQLFKDPLSDIPMYYASQNIQSKFENIAEEIINNRKQNLDTTDLEQQIDNLVYKLYELTYDEVLVVEPEFTERMSREEYEGLKVE
jgi:adenine-specific DNA-methyltransferase